MDVNDSPMTIQHGYQVMLTNFCYSPQESGKIFTDSKSAFLETFLETVWGGACQVSIRDTSRNGVKFNKKYIVWITGYVQWLVGNLVKNGLSLNWDTVCGLTSVQTLGMQWLNLTC